MVLSTPFLVAPHSTWAKFVLCTCHWCSAQIDLVEQGETQSVSLLGANPVLVVKNTCTSDRVLLVESTLT